MFAVKRPGSHGLEIVRFDRAERIVHWCNALLFLGLLTTGFALYAGPLSAMVGRREVVRAVHVYCGLALPVPIVLGLLLRAGGCLRADVRELARWTPADRRWWRPRDRAAVQLGKFNPGQKLNAAFVAASIPVMLATGSIMRWFAPFPDDWRTGATFVHDWFALGLLVSIVGHVALALADPTALRAMVRGTVPSWWARSKRPAWATASGDARAGDERAANEASSDGVPG